MRSMLLAALTGCVTQAEVAPEPTLAAVDRATGLAVTFRAPAWVSTANGYRLEVEGRANRDLASTFSFVPDDAFGEATLVNARTFRVAWAQDHEINTALSGTPLLVRLDLADGTSATAQVTVDLRTRDLGGARPIGVVEPLRPVFVDDPVSTLRYRMRFTTYDADDAWIRHPSAATTETQGTFLWKVDWTYEDLIPYLARGRDRMDLHAIAGGATLTRRLRIEPRVAHADLTHGDPYAVWPSVCEDDIDACLSALPDGTDDFGACGDYRPVQRCLSQGECWFAPESPLALSPGEPALAGASDALAAHNATCAGAGAWCELAWTASYTRPACPSEPAGLRALIALAGAADQSGATIEQGVIHGRTNGPAELPESVLQAIEADYGAPITGGFSWQQLVPCPNCTEYQTWYLLDLPAADRVVVLTGTVGWDS